MDSTTYVHDDWQDSEMFAEPCPFYERDVNPIFPRSPQQPSQSATPPPPASPTVPAADRPTKGPREDQDSGEPLKQKRKSAASAPPSTNNDLPGDIKALANIINKLPKNTQRLPTRKALRTSLPLKDEIQSGSGCFKKHRSKLRGWIGDERLFSKELWAYLTER